MHVEQFVDPTRLPFVAFGGVKESFNVVEYRQSGVLNAAQSLIVGVGRIDTVRTASSRFPAHAANLNRVGGSEVHLRDYRAWLLNLGLSCDPRAVPRREYGGAQRTPHPACPIRRPCMAR